MTLSATFDKYLLLFTTKKCLLLRNRIAMSENIVHNVLEVSKNFLRIIPRSTLVLDRFPS